MSSRASSVVAALAGSYTHSDESYWYIVYLSATTAPPSSCTRRTCSTVATEGRVSIRCPVTGFTR
jgi:hypothetical protein